MRKLLLILFISIAGISAIMAQSVRVEAAKNMNEVSKMHINKPFVDKKVKDLQSPKVFSMSNKLNQGKIVYSTKQGDKEIQLLKNENGSFSKKMVQTGSKQKLNRNNPAPNNKNVSNDFTFFESFEGWDGLTSDWTPEGWSRDNKTESETWYVSDGGYFNYPTDGDYLMSVDWQLPFDDDFNFIILDPRDETLISPAFTPVLYDYLAFDIHYSTYFMYYDMFTDEFFFDDPLFNIQVLLSTDDGKSWNVIWDASKEYTVDDIDILDNAMWSTKLLSLSDYIGKSIKVAFRYTDREGGDNIALDNIAVRELNPTALYMRPQGFFNLGMSQEWRSVNADLMIGQAYSQTIWRNRSTEPISYKWEFENPDGSGSIITSTEKNPNTPYPFNWYAIPKLTAYSENKNSNYQWGVSDMKYFMAGGDTDISGTVIGVGNYDLSYDFYSYYFVDGDYAFGTSTDNSIDGVANYFEKPVNKYILDEVWAALGEFSFPEGTEFTMVIRRVSGGYVSDTIATATCTTADVIALANHAYTMPFSKFKIIDEETGLEVEHEYLEIEDAILIEITGFNNIPGSKISFCAQEFNADPTGESNAYIYLLQGDNRYLRSYNGATSLVMNLEITYSFLVADSYDFDVAEGGGEKTFGVISYFSPNGWWLEESPEWVDISYDFDPEVWAYTGECNLNISVEPLPASEDLREAVVKIATLGADLSILVKQNRVTGLSVTNISKNKVVNNNNNFNLSYTKDYSTVTVYNVAGQKIASYNLPESGEFLIPAGNYPKGVYLFNFTGANAANTVKVIK